MCPRALLVQPLVLAAAQAARSFFCRIRWFFPMQPCELTERMLPAEAGALERLLSPARSRRRTELLLFRLNRVPVPLTLAARAEQGAWAEPEGSLGWAEMAAWVDWAAQEVWETSTLITVSAVKAASAVHQASVAWVDCPGSV